MRIELLIPLYKQWGVTHYTFDVIVLTSSEKSFSRFTIEFSNIIIISPCKLSEGEGKIAEIQNKQAGLIPSILSTKEKEQTMTNVYFDYI